MNCQKEQNIPKSYTIIGLFTLSLRLVVGWTYFSAFWRRLILENKLVPDTAGYIGEKFNHFLPNSIGIKPLIEYLVSNPDILWWAMVIFTLVEAIVGFLFMLGFFTRLMSIGVFCLASGILLGSGWLGTTCLDEWQIGVLGATAGFTLFLSGGGSYSLDHALRNKLRWWYKRKGSVWLGSGVLPISFSSLQKIAVGGALGLLLLTLSTNQIFHNGVWGPLHNKSVKPKIEISDARLSDGKLIFNVYRVEGVDVYGSFLIGITLKDTQGNTVFHQDGEALSQFSPAYIRNHYVAKVAPGKHSLIIPLGSKAELTFGDSALTGLPQGDYKLVLTDISGITWEQTVVH